MAETRKWFRHAGNEVISAKLCDVAIPEMSEDEGGSQDAWRIDLVDLGFLRCLRVSAAIISLNPGAFSPGKPAWLIGPSNWARLKGFRRHRRWLRRLKGQHYENRDLGQ
jgi:hypothetical protein